jgi:hypothetical protein
VRVFDFLLLPSVGGNSDERSPTPELFVAFILPFEYH